VHHLHPQEAREEERARQRREVEEEAEESKVEAEAALDSDAKPDSTDYNRETYTGSWPLSIEATIAAAYCLLIASAPFLLAALEEEELTRAHLFESLALIVWIGGTVFLFTRVFNFQSSHWEGHRCLTIVEAVYLLSQILTTVGYGDITPAYPQGQVWVALNVLVALCFYGSIIAEVVDICKRRVHRAVTARGWLTVRRKESTAPLLDWTNIGRHHGDLWPVAKSFGFCTLTVMSGVLFFHYYPGEEKTWQEATYMSVITLSTVGFGVFTATTEAGKAFAAFWMLAGVAGLGALIASWIEFDIQEKRAEKHREDDDEAFYQKVLDACCQPDGRLDKEGFLKYGLMMMRGLSAEDFAHIEARFGALAVPVDGTTVVCRGTLFDEEGPHGGHRAE